LAKHTLDETREIKVLLNQIKALENSIQDIIHNVGAAEHTRYASYVDMARMYNDLASAAENFLNAPNSRLYFFNIANLGNYMDTLWGKQKKTLEQVLVSTKMLYASLEGDVDFVDDELDNLENFIKSRLRAVIFQEPQKEVEVQNAIESLLLGRGFNKGTDYDRETGKFEFSGKEYIPDFIIPKLKLCIEAKLLRKSRKSAIIEEISADITAYGKQYERQLYVVYDLGCIQNEDEFRRDIENTGEVKVVIIKH